MEGVEPPRLAALGSKPSVSTSSTTSPIVRALYIIKSLEKLKLLNIKDRMKFGFFFSFEQSKVMQTKLLQQKKNKGNDHLYHHK